MLELCALSVGIDWDRWCSLKSYMEPDYDRSGLSHDSAG